MCACVCVSLMMIKVECIRRFYTTIRVVAVMVGGVGVGGRGVSGVE